MEMDRENVRNRDMDWDMEAETDTDTPKDMGCLTPGFQFSQL
jgi:hypothetical protein